MGDQIEIGAKLLNPESPVRLRECLTALALHQRTHVLRFEVGIGSSTRSDDEPAFNMTLTHSMGPEHEMVIVPLLAKVFATAMAAYAQAAAEPSGNDSESPKGSAGQTGSPDK